MLYISVVKNGCNHFIFKSSVHYFLYQLTVSVITFQKIVTHAI